MKFIQALIASALVSAAFTPAVLAQSKDSKPPAKETEKTPTKPVVLAEKDPESLVAAKKLADGRFKDFSFGEGGASKKEINATQFAQAVLEELRGTPVDAEYAKEINIAQTEAKKKGEKDSVKKDDAATRGIAGAIVKMKDGTKIGLKDAMPGDFIQFWSYHAKDKEWTGHAGIIDSVRDDKGSKKAKIYGVYSGPSDKGYIGVSGFEVKLVEDDDRRISIARFTGKASAKPEAKPEAKPIVKPKSDGKK